uniref:Sec-independent protein translocase protein TatB n=1 Tax=Pseudomonas sp. TaxID=306 RepID=UPI0028B17B5F
MFGISFSELLLIALIALLVLGPERLPGAARTAGLWIGRLKRSFNAIKTDIEREIGADDLRRHLHDEQRSLMRPDVRHGPDREASPAEPSAPLAPVAGSVSTAPGQ